MSRPQGFKPGSTPSSTLAKQREAEQRQALDKVKESLGQELSGLFEENPHIRQVFACNRDLKQVKTFKETDRIVNLETDPKETYRERKTEIKTTEHLGQRKLLLSEIEFLSRFAENNDVVVYAGAAPGTHQDLLSEMFPFVKFILYDPNEFKVTEKHNRELHKEFFTNLTAEQISQKYQDNRILFISDIRRFDETLTGDIINDLIIGDMNAQMTWLNIMNPVASLLKFRLPYSDYGDDLTEYLDGKIYKQVWAGATSTESRLEVVDRSSRRIYSNKDYEEIFFYHNTVTRTTYFQEVEGVEGLGCHCYDCASELFIIGEYMKYYGNEYIKKWGEKLKPVDIVKVIRDRFN